MGDYDQGVTLLERAAELATFDEHLAAVRRDRRGRVLLIAGEAGIGKTTLIRAFGERAGTARVLWGGCDALHTPRALGPLVDIAEETGGELAAVLRQGAPPGAVVTALAHELRRRPAVVVLEDLHWADEATLDVLHLLTRRIDALPALVIGTYRDDETRAQPLRVALGELPARSVTRVRLAPLTPAAVATLAGPSGDDGELHRMTGGNPFFVTEVLAGGGDLPATVRDAVLARAARLDNRARLVLDAVAIEPARAELCLLEALLEDLTGIDACLASGMLQPERNAVRFRHEIARVAIEEALPPDRRVLLARRAVAALSATIGRRPDPARIAHHAETADDASAVLQYAPLAGERAAALRSHREAAAQFARALRYAESLAPRRRAELLERRSYECYLTDRVPEALEARRAAMAEYRSVGDRLREGDAHRWLSRLAWFTGDNAMAETEAGSAIALLEPFGPGRELAMAYSNMAQLRMLTSDYEAAIAWGERAITLAEQLGETEILAHALNNVGTAELKRGALGGRERLERSLDLALADDLEEHVARAHVNLASSCVELRDYPVADRHVAAGMTYSIDHDLDTWRVYLTGFLARSQLEQGDWDGAAATAADLLADPRVSPLSRMTALVVTGRLRARLGEPDPWPPLDEAARFAAATGEVQRLGPVAAARAEARWLAGDPDRDTVDAETAPALALALEAGEIWLAGELYTWRRRCGIDETPPPGAVAAPYRLQLAGAMEAAADLWRVIGCPYEAALALGESGDEAAQRRALQALQKLGARPAASRVIRTLRERGARAIRSGPRATTRANPGGLTARQLEVLSLVGEGLRNADIAARLFMSERTVAHHVSAILRKLDVATRGQAVAEATRLGIVER